MLKHMAKIRRVVLCRHKGSGMAWIIASKLKGKYLKSLYFIPSFNFIRIAVMEPSEEVCLLTCTSLND